MIDVDAPREQWLIDLRAELAERYHPEFLEEMDWYIRREISAYAQDRDGVLFDGTTAYDYMLESIDAEYECWAPDEED